MNVLKSVSPLTILVTASIFLTIGDLFAAHLSRFGGPLKYPIILLCYMIGMVFLIESYKKENIAVASTILVIANIILLTICGFVFFHEPLYPTKVLGLILGIAAIIILERTKKK